VTTYTDKYGVGRTVYNIYIPNPEGNAFTTVWTFQVLDAGVTQLYPLIRDRSGSSYHYNADYGEAETVYTPGSIGNWVWYDANANGMRDPGELGVSNVLVSLYDSLDNQLETQVTDTNGYYYFLNVYPGDYYVKFTLPSGYNFSPFYGPTYDNKANPNPGPDLGKTAIFTIDPAENDYTWDAGIYQPASVGDFVWNDQNANGIYEGVGVGLAGIQVDLYTSTGTPVASTNTDSNGYYLFSNLTPGSYYIHFTPPAGYNFSPYIPAVTDNKADPTPGPNFGNTPTFTLTSGQSDLTQDAGMWQPASVGDFVWDDLNADGIWQMGEPGINGVTVNLYEQTGLAPIATTTTAGNGDYLFSGLTPGSYFVEFIKPAGYIFSPPFQGSDDQIDSDANPLTGRTPTITVTSGQSQLKWDAGMYQPAAIGDFVWMDLDLNGFYDGGDYPLSNIVVQLYTGTGTLIDSTSTDGSGNYYFTDLSPGSYYLRFVPPSGYTISNYIPSVTENKAIPPTGYTTTFSLISGQIDYTWDAGMLGPELYYATLGDWVWDDQNADGMYQGRGLGIPGVTVNLYLEDGTFIDTTTTDAGGFYYFYDLIPTQDVRQNLRYVVEFILPAGYHFSPYIPSVTYNKADPTPGPNFGRTAPITLGIGQTDLTWDAGMYQYVEIGDFVWDDQNANGIYDGVGPGINGITVNLYTGTGTFVATTTTAGNGNYLFSDLVPGDYIVEFIKPAGYIFSPPFQGTDNQIDSDAYPSTGRTPTITLTSGQSQLKWDAGMYQQAQLGDLVWNDLNVNGMIDPGEPGIPGVTVNLYTQGGIQIDSKTTDANGNYLFNNLTPGDYFLEFIKAAGFNISPYSSGVTDNTADPTTGQTVTITLTSGESELDWDAGMW